MYILVALIVAFGLLGVAYITQNKSEPMLETVEELSVEELSVIETGELEMNFQFIKKIEHGRPVRNNFDEFQERLTEYTVKVIRENNISVAEFIIFAYDKELYHTLGENVRREVEISFAIADLDNTSLIDTTIEDIVAMANEILGPDFVKIEINLNDVKASVGQRLVSQYIYERAHE